MKSYLAIGVPGLLLGFFLSNIGFWSWGEVHKMFVFGDPRLFLTFGGGVALTALGLWLVRGRVSPAPRPIHGGTVLGALMFGVGWALTGACPGIVMVQLAHGYLPALATLGGILAGTAVYPLVHARWFRWNAYSCDA
jgi:uncharacterized membrane protein YedE/YeeE